MQNTIQIVEFDGHYHNDKDQVDRDLLKTEVAEASGYKLVRRSVKDNQVIPVSVLQGL